jgi:hypothetical protein
MAIDETAFHRLVDMGREQGFVTLDQVKAALPVTDMSQKELAETLDRLERSGVSVELDEDLTHRPRDAGMDGSANMPDIRLPEPPENRGEPVISVRPNQSAGTGQTVPPPPRPDPGTQTGVEPETAGRGSTLRTAVVIGTVLLLIVLALLLWS